MNYPVMEKAVVMLATEKYIAICLPKHWNCKSCKFDLYTAAVCTLLEQWLQSGLRGIMDSSKSTENIPV